MCHRWLETDVGHPVRWARCRRRFDDLGCLIGNHQATFVSLLKLIAKRVEDATPSAELSGTDADVTAIAQFVNVVGHIYNIYRVDEGNAIRRGVRANLRVIALVTLLLITYVTNMRVENDASGDQPRDRNQRVTEATGEERQTGQSLARLTRR